MVENDQWRIARTALWLAASIMEDPNTWPQRGLVHRLRLAYLEYSVLCWDDLDANKYDKIRKNAVQFNKALKKLSQRDRVNLMTEGIVLSPLDIPHRRRE